MFAAARVMATGQAGLKSLPYFVDELSAQGITQLAPWAADHDKGQLDALEDTVRERRAGDWSKIFQIGSSDTKIGIPLPQGEPDAPIKRLIEGVNPDALKSANNLADHPARLAAWSRISIWQYCRETADLWREFKYQKGIAEGQQLAVVIPYCPEGPTSGTIGMYLGAALRKQFEREGRGHELVIWGIELCPPVNEDSERGPLNDVVRKNAFRGFVAREEVLKGLPLSEEVGDTTANPPFDITIAFDGGTAANDGPVTEIIDEIHSALDRAAAQATACLLRGAAGGDVAESTQWLIHGKRWNAHLVHVVSEHSYERGCRYLRYQVRLPWERNREDWDSNSTRQKKSAYLQRIDQIRPLLESEPDGQAKEKVWELVGKADEVRPKKGVPAAFVRGFRGVFLRKRDRQEVEDHLSSAIRLSESLGQELNQEAPSEVTYRNDPFCVNIAWPLERRKEIAKKSLDDQLQPIADLLGNGSSDARDRVQRLFSRVLGRRDAVDSSAFFEQVIAIDNPRAGNRAFRPAREMLRDFIAPEKQGNNGALNFLPHEPLQPLRWRPKNDIEFDIEVDYTFLTLARCREEDGFQDVSTYERLQEIHMEITGDPGTHKEHARYYGVKPPVALTAPVLESPAEVDPSPNGAVESGPATVTNGHHAEVGFAEQQA